MAALSPFLAVQATIWNLLRGRRDALSPFLSESYSIPCENGNKFQFSVVGTTLGARRRIKLNASRYPSVYRKAAEF